METWQIRTILTTYARTTVRSDQPFVIDRMYAIADGVVVTIGNDGETTLWYERQIYKPNPALKEDVVKAHPGVHGVKDACTEANWFHRAGFLIARQDDTQISWHNEPIPVS